MLELAHKVVQFKTSTRSGVEFILVFVAEFQMNIIQELVDIGQLQDLLIGYDEDQLKLVVELVLQREVIVIERIRSGAFLKDERVLIKHQSDWRQVTLRRLRTSQFRLMRL